MIILCWEIKYVGTRRQRLTRRVEELLGEGGYIRAIKFHREETGSSLKDAKKFVDEIRGDRPWQ